MYQIVLSGFVIYSVVAMKKTRVDRSAMIAVIRMILERQYFVQMTCFSAGASELSGYDTSRNLYNVLLIIQLSNKYLIFNTVCM